MAGKQPREQELREILAENQRRLANADKGDREALEINVRQVSDMLARLVASAEPPPVKSKKGK